MAAQAWIVILKHEAGKATRQKEPKAVEGKGEKEKQSGSR